MSDQDILASLVKERENCRQLVQVYQGMWAGEDAGEICEPPRDALLSANRILTQVLQRLRSLPEKPVHQLASEADREDARRLLRDIGDLLERAMVAERETRERAVNRRQPPAGAARHRAMGMYGKT